MLKSSLLQHRDYVQNNIEATGQHFNNFPGYSLPDIISTVIKQVRKTDTRYSMEREEYYIILFKILHTMASIEKYNRGYSNMTSYTKGGRGGLQFYDFL